jgi:hypothetical protein
VDTFVGQINRLIEVVKSHRGVKLDTELTISGSLPLYLGDSYEESCGDPEIELTLGELLTDKGQDALKQFLKSITDSLSNATVKIEEIETEHELNSILEFTGLENVGDYADDVTQMLANGCDEQDFIDFAIEVGATPDEWIIGNDYWIDECRETGYVLMDIHATLDGGAYNIMTFGVSCDDYEDCIGECVVDKFNEKEFVKRYCSDEADESRKRRMESMRMHNLIRRSRNRR